MTNTMRRAKTMLIIVQSTSLSLPPNQSHDICDELNETIRIRTLMPLRRRRLLQILHLARCLESALKEAVLAQGIHVANQHKNMGGYLSALANTSPPIIPNHIKDDCKNKLTNLRNRVAHSSGQYPSGDIQMNSAFDAAHACISLALK